MMKALMVGRWKRWRRRRRWRRRHVADLARRRPRRGLAERVAHAASKEVSVAAARHLLDELLLPHDLRGHPVLGCLLQLQLALELPDLELESLVLHRAHVLPLHVVEPLAQLGVLLSQLVSLALQGLDGQTLVLDCDLVCADCPHTSLVPPHHLLQLLLVLSEARGQVCLLPCEPQIALLRLVFASHHIIQLTS